MWQTAEKGDVVIGQVASIQESGIVITLLCTDKNKARFIDELRIPVSDSPKYCTKIADIFILLI